MSKLEQAARPSQQAVAAMQLALEALEQWKLCCDPSEAGNWPDEDEAAITALREALNHSADAGKMIGCAYCNNPLFAGTKCNNCGRVTLAEQAEQEAVAKPIGKEGRELWFKEVIDSTNAVLRETNEVEQIVNQERIEEHRALTSRNNAVVKESLTVQWQAEQEPVAWAIHYPECWDTAAYPTLESALNQLAACFKCDNDECAAPVRTKDLTDDEIEAICAALPFDENFDITVARAVIQEFRRKNGIV